MEAARRESLIASRSRAFDGDADANHEVRPRDLAGLGDDAAAGLSAIEVPADRDGPAVKGFVWSPCTTPAADIKVGPYILPGVRNCPIVGDKLPLVVISHGHGGNRLGHHDTAETLADGGFVVVALDHPGDTHSDMSRAGDLSVLIERPTDIKRLIDYMLGAYPDAKKIDQERIGFFGFSRGGYTGLVIGGANPDFRNAHLPCPDAQAPICGEIERNEVPREPLTHDSRVKAIVIADPLSSFPTADSLKDVKAPISALGLRTRGRRRAAGKRRDSRARSVGQARFSRRAKRCAFRLLDAMSP